MRYALVLDTRGVPAVNGLLPLRLDEAVTFFDRELRRAGMRIDVRIPKPSGYEVFYSVEGFSGRYHGSAPGRRRPRS